MLFRKKFFNIFLLFSFLIILKVNGDDDPNVIIIGAGASGIAAASKLFENGFKNVKILEAENRIGGRIHTTNFGAYLVDLGAQWVHGEKGNVAFEMASPLGLLENGRLSKHVDELVDSSGKIIDQKVSKDLADFDGQIQKKLPQYAESHKNVPLGEYYKNKLDNYIEAHPILKEIKKGLLHLHDMSHVRIYSADTWDDVSTTVTEFQNCPGGYYLNWKERGCNTIFDIMMKRYPNPEKELPVMSNTELNAEVSSIDYKDVNGKVTVKTINGKTYYADHVIFTCSLGVLKDKHNTLFQPPLSEEKQKSIKGLQYGNVAKLFLYFDQVWWPNEASGIGFSFVWKDNDLEMLEKDPEKSWLQGLTGFYTVEHKPKLLAGWVSGKYSREMEKLSDEQIKNHCIEVVQRFLGNSYNVSTLTGVVRSKWNSNKHFLGTYGYRSPKTDDAENVGPAKLAEPILREEKPVVLFAGEATSPHHYSTMHGAIETGWREAERLIKHYPNLPKN